MLFEWRTERLCSVDIFVALPGDPIQTWPLIFGIVGLPFERVKGFQVKHENSI